MRKYYLYAAFLVLLSLIVSLGVYYYQNSRRVEYRYGTFVELPSELGGGKKELCA